MEEEKVKKKFNKLFILIPAIMLILLLCIMFVVLINNSTPEQQFSNFNNTISLIQQTVRNKIKDNVLKYSYVGKNNLEKYRFIGIVKGYTELNAQKDIEAVYDVKKIKGIDLAKLDSSLKKYIKISNDEFEKYSISPNGIVYYDGYDYNGIIYYNKDVTSETVIPQITKDIFVSLTKDGELLFNNVNDFSEYSIEKNYGNLSEFEVPYLSSTEDLIALTLPWQKELSLIESATFLCEIVPEGPVNWFYSCHHLKNINNISNLKTNYVTDMSNLFCYCYELKELDVTGFNTSSVLNMVSLFRGCNALTQLDLSNFDTINVLLCNDMLTNCNANIIVGDNWTLNEMETSYVYKKFLR